MTRHDHYYKFFDAAIREIASQKIVLDLGTFYSFRKQLKEFESLFVNVCYFSMDYKITQKHGNYTPNVDGDIQNLPFKSEVVDAVICKDVLEHVPRPHDAVAEIYRVLKPGGKAFFSVPFIHSYHGSGSEKNRDYYRFSQDGIVYLFREFSQVEIVPAGGLLFVIRAFTPLFLAKYIFSPVLMPLVNLLDKLTMSMFRNPAKITPMYLIYTRK